MFPFVVVAALERGVDGGTIDILGTPLLDQRTVRFQARPHTGLCRLRRHQHAGQLRIRRQRHGRIEPALLHRLPVQQLGQAHLA